MTTLHPEQRGRLAGIAVTLAVLSPLQPFAAEESAHFDLEALMSMKVTSVSRKPERYFDAPSALSVLTSDDIRRSGALTLADSLRYAPAVHVARSSGNAYAISTRGFSSLGGNKLQVLMDGRSLYTPLFSGVFWEVQDTLLEDVERIEVVRGPGATQWGANAVNGAINIITKSARDTQGGLIQGGGGNEEVGFGTLRYGAKAGESTYWRAYAKYRYRDDLRLSNGADAQDFSSHYQAGFRSDTYLRDIHQITVQGDVYWNDFGIFAQPDGEHKGGNILGRWSRTFSEESDLQLQLYYDRSDRDVPRQYAETRDTLDLDFQHRLEIGERNNLIWGSNLRVSSDDTAADRAFNFDPQSRTIYLINGFVQDELTLWPDLLKTTVGTKVEHNDFSGFEVQPQGRLILTPNPAHVIWASVSRAVRTPTRIESDLRFQPLPGGPLTLLGNSEYDSEELVAYELGYRVRPFHKLSLDFSTFYNVYESLRTLEPVGPGPFPLTVGNERHGNTYGFEAIVRYEPFDWWDLTASYRLLREDLEFSTTSRDFTEGTTEVNDPRHIGRLRSSLTLPYHLEFDQMVRFVDSLPKPFVSGYAELDLRLGWRPRPGLELSIVAVNLLDRSHPEFSTTPFQTEVERSVYGKIMWFF